MRAFCWIAASFASVIVLINVSAYLRRAAARAQIKARDREHPLGLLDALWAFSQECAAQAAVILLFPAGWWLARCHGGGGRQGPLILVHDKRLNAGSMWLLAHRLRRAGWGPVRFLNHGTSVASLDHLNTMLDEVGAPHRAITFVGHGSGGAVVSAYIQSAPMSHHGRIVTLGTPCGTGTPSNASGRFDVIAIFSTFDARVAASAALNPNGLNVQLGGVGHYALLFSYRVYELVLENLLAPLPAPPPAP